MARVKRSNASRNYRKKVLKSTKGFYSRNKNCYSIAIQKLEKAGQYAYRDRRVRRREFRALWIVRLNAALRELGLKYSVFINMMKRNNIELNRKVLANIASQDTAVFKEIVLKVANS
jgi:large subunit ribosomal protein L20